MYPEISPEPNRWAATLALEVSRVLPRVNVHGIHRAVHVVMPPLTDTVGAGPILPVPVLSIVVPVRNEAANIGPLIAEITAAVSGITHEIVYVDDGSTDETAEQLRLAQRRWVDTLVVRRHHASCGQSAAIMTGVHVARGTWIATLDGDGQNDPADLPILFQQAQASTGPFDLIAGHRTRRKDGWVKRRSSRVANRVRAALLGDSTPDTGCGLKVFRRSAFLALPHFDHMHRYLPALFIRAGGSVQSAPVNHRPRVRGQSKYGTFDRLWVGLVDMAGVAWLQRRGSLPMVDQPAAADAPVLEQQPL